MHKKSTYLPITFHSFPFFNLFCMPHHCRSIHIHFWDPAKFWGEKQRKKKKYYLFLWSFNTWCGTSEKRCRKFGSSEESFVLSCPKGLCTYHQPKITSTSVRGWSVNGVFHTACSMCHQKWINWVLMRLRHCAASPALRSLLYVVWKKKNKPKHKQPTKQPSAIAWWLISRFQNFQRVADAHMY